MDLEILREFTLRNTPLRGHKHINQIFSDLKQRPAQVAMGALVTLGEGLKPRGFFRRRDLDFGQIMIGLNIGIAISAASESEAFKAAMRKFFEVHGRAKGENVHDFTRAKA